MVEIEFETAQHRLHLTAFGSGMRRPFHPAAD